MARYLQPTMLVFEDIDLIAQERETNGLATVLGELMNQIDGCEPNDQVLFIMNTNSMERLEQAVRNRPGRVDQIIHIPLPDLGDRKRLIRHFARGLRASDAAVEALSAATDGVTPAMLKEVVKRAAVMAVERLKPATGDGDGQAAGHQIELQESDLLLAVQQVLALRSDLHKMDPLKREPIRFG
jgi:SpoVK/Ycf46/Vps4 family AAA+-type ATPase